MNNYEHRLLILLLLLSAFLSVSILTRGHIWWDDFASYVMQGQSLLDGSPALFVEHNSFTILNSSYPPGPIAYPWGFPLLLAPVLAVFGLNTLALKLVNTLFYLLFLVATHALARLRLSPGWALAVTAALAFNPALLRAHDLILSDIPFLFFSTLALYLIESGEGRYPLRRDVLTGLVIFAASAVRTNGALLLVPLLVGQFLRFRTGTSVRANWRLLLVPYGVFALLLALEWVILPRGQESYLSHYTMLTLRRFLANFWYYIRLPADLFKEVPLGLLFLGLILFFFFFSLVVNFRRNAVLLSYIAATLALFVTWPETQGLRFIYPILPLVLLVAADGMQAALLRVSGAAARLLPGAGVLAAAALILLSFGVSARIGWLNITNDRYINGPFDPISTEMFEFVREHTPPDSVIIFFKPRAMRLLTGRDSFLTENCADFTKGDYAVIHEKQGYNGQIGDVEVACPGLNLPVVYNNKRFTIFQVPH